MTRIVVTGASGFIGSYLVPYLRKYGHEVIEANSRSGDIAEEAMWAAFPRAEVVIHLAGKTFVPDSWSDPAGFIKCNLLGTVAALNYCRRNDARLVFVSSYLYGNPQTLPIPETAPLIANNPYALSKKLGEDACQFYADSFNVDITILRPFNVYGPGQPEHFLIPSIVRQVKTGEVVEVKDLEPKRDYVYVNDLVDAIGKAVGLHKGINIFNVGSGVSHSVAEIIQIVQDLKKVHLPVRSSEERRRGEVMNTVADINLIGQVLGWVPRWTLAQGLRKIVLEE